MRSQLIAALICCLPVAAAGAQSASLKSERAASSATVNAMQLKGNAPIPAARTDTGYKVLITREVYQYDGNSRRDPFVSLIGTSDLRPMLNDLKLVGVAFDPSGRNSVAVLRDITSKDQYKVRVGQTLGRMRVAAIQEKAVIFTIEEFGYSRQELLPIAPPDSTKLRPRQ